MKTILASLFCVWGIGSGVVGLAQTPPLPDIGRAGSSLPAEAAGSGVPALPPMPPDAPQKPKGHTSITQADNAAVKARQAAQKETTVYLPAPKPYVQPATQRVLDEVSRQKANPVKPAPMTPHPGLKPPLRAPRQKP